LALDLGAPIKHVMSGPPILGILGSGEPPGKIEKPVPEYDF
jgi:hypothetical protein